MTDTQHIRTTRDGRLAHIKTASKAGMSIFTVFGTLEGRPCHWTADGQFRMDGKEDGRDLMDFPPHDREQRR